ncbi:hypothetical protein M2650_11010 [Luteimonas sp. SX5]|uniref:DUF202 domain-containing protein n=1 Tax=Luteimonas galliterrae TaxID=2940486 RepID=A0ABT0MJW3_9GAMM|nr:hypothetical protein [Luteimonas galliterrae]MCL1635152.1 hypothetical protein [Luteimonas galliterrae]
MPASNPSPRSRYALSLWFLGIGLLGLIQFFGKAHREGGPTAVAWIWLAGSLLLLVLALLLAWREHRRGPNA